MVDEKQNTINITQRIDGFRCVMLIELCGLSRMCFEKVCF